MGLMSGLSRGLSAAGYAGAELFSKQALEEQRSKLEEEKALRIADALEARKVAPMNQFSGIMSAKMAEQVPQDAAPVSETGLTLVGAAQSLGKRTYDGQEQDATGITGNAAQVSDIMKTAQDTLRNPTASAEQKANAQGLIDQIQGQIKTQGDVNAQDVAGKTRGRTFDEALDAARKEAALTNPRAFVAGEAMFADERKTAREDKKDAAANRRLDIQEDRNATLEKYQQRREDRLDSLAEAQLALQKARANKEDSRGDEMAQRESRAATAKALDGVNADIKSLSRDIADPMLQAEQKKVIQRQLDDARTEAKRYRSALAGAGLEGSDAPPSPQKPFDPNDFRPKGDKPDSRPPTLAPTPLAARPTASTASNEQSIDISSDPVLSSIKNSMSQLDASDPGNIDKVKAYGKARNDRLAQLQEKYGRLSKLTGY